MIFFVIDEMVFCFLSKRKKNCTTTITFLFFIFNFEQSQLLTAFLWKDGKKKKRFYTTDVSSGNGNCSHIMCRNNCSVRKKVIFLGISCPEISFCSNIVKEEVF